ncbi:SDR family oxidoreductase [Streptomyces diastatochromogenes]|uniref:NAD(P)-binding domain-containing protein n=1 Tax=Streptomyces diastatochromogenes TaxID=42236 RepID=A0A233SCD0_STRDA|nr:SDR family oxidoreductase [Streptomyces diastatochromogenes]OXY93315.1 hypothetical protein BEK98_24280 [Streptomyces diastatochromogenes]
MHGPIAVIGGAGRLGALVTARLAGAGERVRVVSRHPERGAAVPAEAEVRQADVRYADTLGPALRGSAAVVLSVEPGTADSGPDSPETTMYGGVRNVLAALADQPERPRLVLVSQIFVTRREHPMNAYGRLLDWRRRGEEAVRDSGLPYTVVRPGWLTDDGTPGAGVRLEQGDRGDGWVSRASVAEACVRALGSTAATGRTFEIYNEPGPAPADWEPLFHGLTPDRVLALMP